MINLLPQTEKEIIFLRRIKNLVLVLGGVVIIALVCLTLVLLAVKFYILAKSGDQNFLLQEAQKEYRSPASENLKNTIQKYNRILPAVLSFYQGDAQASTVVEIISEIERPDGVRFINLSVDGQSDKNMVEAVISGVSDTRENLVAFQKTLEGRPEIKNISFSPESWISPTDANFNITLRFNVN